MQTLLRDFRYALRQLRKNPGFTAIAVAALALGIGLSTTIFSVFYNGVLYPFPYRDAQRLTVIGVRNMQQGPDRMRSVFRLDDVAAFRQGNHSFDDIVAYSGWDVAYQRKSTSIPQHGCVLTPKAMEFWGVRPLLGRGLEERDAKPGASPTVLLSYPFWKSSGNPGSIPRFLWHAGREPYVHQRTCYFVFSMAYGVHHAASQTEC